MGVVDWRAWVAQSGGTMPTAPNPPGTPWQHNQVFPGVGPIPDLISGTTSIPPYPNTPTTINAVDPFYVGTYPNGGGWVSPMELTTWPAGSPKATVPKGPNMRPVVPGVTS